MFDPTDEQVNAIDLFRTGGDLVVEAGAGTGKTSTLVLMAEDTDRFGQYVAFNKAIVTDADGKFPKSVKCNTAHSLAYRTVGWKYKHRLNGPRVMSWELANMLGISSLKVGDKTLAAGFLAGAVMKAITNFCNSADVNPAARHFNYIDGIDEPYADGKRSYSNNDFIAKELSPYLAIAWADITNDNGRLPFRHEHYLKIWQLGNPKIDADFILFDEAQDANPVMQAIVTAQDHAQLVWVGDSQQQIYEFTGAVNAMAELDAERSFLTQSWRFGQPIADAANEVLNMLGAELRLTGSPHKESKVEALTEKHAYLARTNAGAIREVFAEIAKGHKPHLVGGGGEIISFAKGAKDLMEKGSTGYPDLACFSSWAEVQEYVASDQQGDELRLMVKVMDDFGPDAIMMALDRQPTEAKADLVISTAHKAKGREWETVQLAGDFPPREKINASELRLLYVAATRAMGTLDHAGAGIFYQEPAGLVPDDMPTDAMIKEEEASVEDNVA